MKYEVTLFRIPWGKSVQDKESWYQYRESGLQFQTDKPDLEAAEYAFYLTNCPDFLLELEERAILEEQSFQGPSVSVGDICRVESTIDRKLPDYYLCKNIGWELYKGDRIQLLKFLG